jgi:hypothetical protein
MPSSINDGFGQSEYVQGLGFEEWSPTHFSIKAAPEQRINEENNGNKCVSITLARLDY